MKTVVDNLTTLFVATAVVAGIGRPIRAAVAKKSVGHRVRGWYVYGLAVGAYFVWGLPRLRDPIGDELGGMAAAGLVFGLVSGNVIGWLAWHFYHQPALRHAEDDSPPGDAEA